MNIKNKDYAIGQLKAHENKTRIRGAVNFVAGVSGLVFGGISGTTFAMASILDNQTPATKICIMCVCAASFLAGADRMQKAIKQFKTANDLRVEIDYIKNQKQK